MRVGRRVTRLHSQSSHFLDLSPVQEILSFAWRESSFRDLCRQYDAESLANVTRKERHKGSIQTGSSFSSSSAFSRARCILRGTRGTVRAWSVKIFKHVRKRDPQQQSDALRAERNKRMVQSIGKWCLKLAFSRIFPASAFLRAFSSIFNLRSAMKRGAYTPRTRRTSFL